MVDAELDVKVVDFASLAVPAERRNGFKVFGTFTLLARPVRITGCRFVVAPDGHYLEHRL